MIILYIPTKQKISRNSVTERDLFSMPPDGTILYYPMDAQHHSDSLSSIPEI